MNGKDIRSIVNRTVDYLDKHDDSATQGTKDLIEKARTLAVKIEEDDCRTSQLREKVGHLKYMIEHPGDGNVIVGGGAMAQRFREQARMVDLEYMPQRKRELAQVEQDALSSQAHLDSLLLTLQSKVIPSLVVRLKHLARHKTPDPRSHGETEELIGLLQPLDKSPRKWWQFILGINRK